jgi:predicted nucleic-acid-binding protein
MNALDTNILARLLLRDDLAQHEKVVGLLARDGEFTAPLTVFLELVWVLEAHDKAPADIEAALMLLLGLPNFKPADAPVLRSALSAYAQGMDFADALHLCMSSGADGFMTFDKAFARKAGMLGMTPKASLV